MWRVDVGVATWAVCGPGCSYVGGLTEPIPVGPVHAVLAHAVSGDAGDAGDAGCCSEGHTGNVQL
jgi:hypothetical protein